MTLVLPHCKRYASFSFVLLLPLFPAWASGSDCQGLAALNLPSTTISTAEAVPAGRFTAPAGSPPGGSALNVPAFCRVVGVLKPTNDSVIRFEVWLPVAGWNGKSRGVGN